MLPKNVLMLREYERQNRNRLLREAENARDLAGNGRLNAPKLNKPAWKLTLNKVRNIRLRLNPTG